MQEKESISGMRSREKILPPRMTKTSFGKPLDAYLLLVMKETDLLSAFHIHDRFLCPYRETALCYAQVKSTYFQNYLMIII